MNPRGGQERDIVFIEGRETAIHVLEKAVMTGAVS